jgi:hypothetical protein
MPQNTRSKTVQIGQTRAETSQNLFEDHNDRKFTMLNHPTEAGNDRSNKDYQKT